MKTIPSNRRAAVLSQITAAKSYTLGNCFTGVAVSDVPKFLDYVTRMGSAGIKFKVCFDKATGKGQITFHSNEWYEFVA